MSEKGVDGRLLSGTLSPARVRCGAVGFGTTLANDTLQIIGLPPLVFLAADDRLLAAARAKGLATDNPNAVRNDPTESA